MLSLRKTDPALRDGTQESVNNNDPNVFAFLRKSGDRTVLVALNMSNHPHTVAFHLPSGTKLTPLLTTPTMSTQSVSLDRVALPPFGTIVASVD